MVIQRQHPYSRQTRRRTAGALQFDLAIAMAILVVALIPITHTIRQERQLCRGLYFRSVALSLVDGEIEVLKAGEWRSFPDGQHDYPMTAPSAVVLPKGNFTLTRSNSLVRLEWIPNRKGNGGRVIREFEIQSDL